MEKIITTYLDIVIAPTLSFIATFLIIPVVIRLSKKNNLLDKPDHRKQHKEPIPTMGGIGIVAGMIASAFVWTRLLPLEEAISISMAIVMLLATGILDDLKGLSASKRFLIQLLAGLFAVRAGIVLHIPDGLFGISHFPSFVEYGFTVFLIAGVTNSFNLIDGIDGLAGGLGYINSIIFGFLFIYFGNTAYAVLAFCFAAALLAFLKYNFNPARIFMGDTGSLVLGFLMVVMGIKVADLSVSTAHPTTFLLLVFSILLIPVIDTLRVFLFRMLKKKSPFSADRSHIHHLLLKTGFDHKKASLVLYMANILLVSEAYLIRSIRTEFAIVILFLSAVALIEILSIKRLFRIRTRINVLYSDYKKMSGDNLLLLKYINQKK